MKRVIVSLLPFPIIAIIAWLGGYDFDSRGFMPAWGFAFTVFSCVAIYTFPGWRK